MTSLILAAALAAFVAVVLVLRIRYGELHVSELPVLMLTLLAGSNERERLRLILSHREREENPFLAAPPCWCSYRHGRAGVHGREAIALYRAQCEAAMAGTEHPANLRWERRS